MSQSAWDEFRGENLQPLPSLTSDSDLEHWVRSKAGTAYHPVGTCRMGEDELSVTDSEGRVRGVEGLRVIDASLMPTIITGNTNAPTIMIAEKLSDVIRKLRLAPTEVAYYESRLH